MKLRMTGRVGGDSGFAESDPWVPFTAIWGVENDAMPLYWRPSGQSGGEVEVKVDPVSGALREVIVIDPPPPPAVDGAGTARSKADYSPCSVPVFEISPWGVERNPDYSQPKHQIISSTEDLSFLTHDGRTRLAFSSDPVALILTCGRLQVEVSSDESLVAITGDVLQMP